MLSWWSHWKSNPLKKIHFKQIWISFHNTGISWSFSPLQKQFWSPAEWSRVWIVNDTLLNMPIVLSKRVCLPTQEGRLLTDFRSASNVIGKIRTSRGRSDSAGNVQVQDGFLLLQEDHRKLVPLFSCWKWLGWDERSWQVSLTPVIPQLHVSQPPLLSCLTTSLQPWELNSSVWRQTRPKGGINGDGSDTVGITWLLITTKGRLDNMGMPFVQLQLNIPQICASQTNGERN